MSKKIQEILELQSKMTVDRPLLDINKRIKILNSIHCSVQDHSEEIIKALKDDFGKSSDESR